MSFAQPLVAEDELANRLRELVALPQALKAPRAVTHSFRRGSMRGLEPQAAAPSSCVATCATATAWPAARLACRAAPLRSLAAAFAWPAAVRAWDIVISPRTQARACSIA